MSWPVGAAVNGLEQGQHVGYCCTAHCTRCMHQVAFQWLRCRTGQVSAALAYTPQRSPNYCPPPPTHPTHMPRPHAPPAVTSGACRMLSACGGRRAEIGEMVVTSCWALANHRAAITKVGRLPQLPWHTVGTSTVGTSTVGTSTCTHCPEHAGTGTHTCALGRSPGVQRIQGGVSSSVVGVNHCGGRGT